MGGLSVEAVDRVEDGIEFGCGCSECPPDAECAGGRAPVAWRVERDGDTVAVCTRCVRSFDTRIEPLVTASIPGLAFFAYDPVGALALAVELSGEDVGQETRGRHDPARGNG